MLSGGGGCRLPVFAYQVACFYAGRDSMSACQQKSVADGWMKGRNSTPKQRALCQCCLDWLVGEGLAECMPLPSDAILPLHLPCKLPVAGGNLLPGRNQDAVPWIAAYGEDAVMGEHLLQPCNRVIDVSLALTGITSSTSPDAVPLTLVDGEEAAELGSCYYASSRQSASHCRRLARTVVRMIGLRAYPKKRPVCNVCAA